MIRLVLFFKKIYFFLLFVVLEITAINYYQKSSLYSNTKILNASVSLVGGIYDQVEQLKRYIGLKKENEALMSRMIFLQNELERYTAVQPEPPDSAANALAGIINRSDTMGNLFVYSTAAVVKNSISTQHNFITIDKGARDGVEKDMALVHDGGVVGYVLDCSEKYAVAISMLNTNFRTSGKIKGEAYFGSIFWDGTSYNEVTFSEVPKYARLAVGDTIVTTSYSSIFPPELMIGTISEFELINGTYYQAKVKLKTNMGKLKYVTLAKYIDREERTELERRVAEDYSF